MVAAIAVANSAPLIDLFPAAVAVAGRVSSVAVAGRVSPATRSRDLFADLARTANAVRTQLAPLGLGRRYGLFASMTTFRWELVFEGSRDGGQTFREYQFPYKPGNVGSCPVWVVPGHMPRLDWRLWFVPLKLARGGDLDAWVLSLAKRILEGSGAVRRLFAHDPFAGEGEGEGAGTGKGAKREEPCPPTYLRLSLYNYHFSGGSAGRGREREEEGEGREGGISGPSGEEGPTGISGSGSGSKNCRSESGASNGSKNAASAQTSSSSDWWQRRLIRDVAMLTLTEDGKLMNIIDDDDSDEDSDGSDHDQNGNG
jgi:hypothetical protein